MKLPTEKTPPNLTATQAKVLLYGVPKIGKSTLAAGIDPDHTLFLACEAGLSGLNTYQLPIGNWREFREAGALLASKEHKYTTVVIDTVDELLQMCTDDVLSKLGVTHAEDLGYGKGWRAISDEFRLRVNRLCSLDLGVWFISHAKEHEKNTLVGTVSRYEPTISGATGRWLTGLVDYIFFATSQLTDGGEERILRTEPSGSWEAGGRIKLPDPLLLDAATVREAMETATTRDTK